MTITELRDKVIKEGIKSVKATETGARRRGGIKGFEECRKLETTEDFENALNDRHIEKIKLQDIYYGNQDQVALDNYWEHRYATLQIEYCYEILKVAWGNPVISARAGLKYAELTGAVDAPATD